MEAGLGALVREYIGPLPLIPAEQILLDLERARMTAEDYSQGNARQHGSHTWRQTHRNIYQNCVRMNHAINNIDTAVQWHERGQTNASGRPLTPEDCLAQIRAEVNVVMSDDSESDQDPDQDSEEDSGQTLRRQ